jgi:transposase
MDAEWKMVSGKSAQPLTAYLWLGAPTYSSWMNQVERWFSALTTKYLQRSVHRSVAELTRGIKEWTDNWNNDPKPFIWTKSEEEIFASMRKHLEPTVLEATCDKGH